jgi:hypothetical protein
MQAGGAAVRSPTLPLVRVPRHFLWIFSSAIAVAFFVTGAVHAEGPVYPTPQAVKPLAVGAQVPAVQVQTVRGESVELADRVRESGVLLVFYRGGW